MREIKFRGKDINGRYVYGDLVHYKGNAFIENYQVDEDSVSQLVGLDANGEEIYEGDVIEDAIYGEFSVTLAGCVNGEYCLEATDFIYTLKK